MQEPSNTLLFSFTTRVSQPKVRNIPLFLRTRTVHCTQLPAVRPDQPSTGHRGKFTIYGYRVRVTTSYWNTLGYSYSTRISNHHNTSYQATNLQLTIPGTGTRVPIAIAIVIGTGTYTVANGKPSIYPVLSRIGVHLGNLNPLYIVCHHVKIWVLRLRQAKCLATCEHCAIYIYSVCTVLSWDTRLYG